MTGAPAIAVVGTFDSKGEEHRFLKDAIEQRGWATLTVNVGTRSPAGVAVDIDLFAEMKRCPDAPSGDRDKAIAWMVQRGGAVLAEKVKSGDVSGVISAGGGSGTHLCTGIMRVLPLGVPKVMVSTVASRDMSRVVGTRDVTMMHSVTDLLGVNSISGGILDRAAAAVCAMAGSRWHGGSDRPRVALSFFGFITPGAEAVRGDLERMGYEVIAFHANGTGGMAMEELAGEGYFAGILDLATHELADELKGGYCGGIGPGRFEPVKGGGLPRLVVPGGMDCAVLEFTRDNIPEAYRGRRIFFYDFRSAVRLSAEESRLLAGRLAGRLNHDAANVRILVPARGWSAADREGEPLYDPEVSLAFMERFRQTLDPAIPIAQVDAHINDPAFARVAADTMNRMIKG